MNTARMLLGFETIWESLQPPRIRALATRGARTIASRLA